MALIETVPSGRKTPRFALDPSGKFRLVFTENSDHIVVFGIDREFGLLAKAERDRSCHITGRLRIP